jgi:hypothetical protein
MIFPAINDEENTNLPPATTRVYKVYPRRFAILIIFCICSLSSGFQWIQYVIIQNIVVRYYNQSLPESYDAKNNAVTWTSLSYMVIEYISIQFDMSLYKIGDLYSINVSSYVVIRSLRTENNLLNRGFSQLCRCGDQMF